MRRICALVLVALFSLQTTASAASPGQMRGPNMQPLLSAIEGSQVFALVTGQEGRYEAMHAPRPRFDRFNLPRPSVQQMNLSASRRVRAIMRQGVPLPLNLKQTANTQRAVHDPLAVFKSEQQATVTAQGNVRPQICEVAGRLRPMNGCGNPTPLPHTTPTPSPRPTATPAPTPTPVPTPTPTPVPTPTPTPLTTPTPIPVTPTPVPTATPVQSVPASTSGLKPWWQFETGSVPGIGSWAANIANGNVLVQASDAVAPGRGLSLAFQRTYNSQSTHDHLGADGSIPSAYGDGWTNTYDAHIAYNASLGVISVYDIDGARYDYASNGSGWTAPAGLHVILAYNGGCGYTWTKANGVTYTFYSPSSVSCAGTTWEAGYAGRLTEIQGRNVNNSVQLTYTWLGGNASASTNLSGITVQHSDGQSLTLTFGTVNNFPELTSVTRPDGQIITYSYDSNNRLIGVLRPGNNAASSLPESYTYSSTGHVLSGAAGPRAAISYAANGVITDGDEVLFTANASSQITTIQDYGIVNFTPADSFGIPLQQGEPSGLQVWRSETFTGYNGGTTVSDSYGHARTWTYDGSGRATQLQAWSSANAALVTNAEWNSSNYLVSTVDAGDNETDYARDANGNVIAIAAPSVSTSNGTLRPSETISYDQYNNVIATCDPNYNASHNSSWTSTPAPSDSLCPTGTGATGATQYIYDYVDSNEPYGVLVNAYTPSGYETTLAYSSGPVFDNYGIPTEIEGTQYSQADGTTHSPTIIYGYDSYGDISSINNGNGAAIYTYDGMNRQITATDPDGYESYTHYNNDNSMSKTETPYQHANGWGTTSSYDADGNAVSNTVYRMTTATSTPAPETTTNIYDGDDRLIENQQPVDPNSDLYANPWTTRYLYDVSQGAGVTITDGNPVQYQAYGNLYKTQELIAADGPTTVSNRAARSVSNTSFADLNGDAFDGLDRTITKFSFFAASSTSSESLIEGTLTYDQSGYFGGDFAGRLTEECNSAQPQECSWYNYDARSDLTQVHFSDALSADRSASYDPAGHTMSLTSAVFGTQSYTYTTDGLELTEQEASGGGVTSPATFTHEYYPDASLKQIDVASSALRQTGLYAYSYRADGLPQTQAISDSAASNVGTTSVALTYTAAGRLSTRTESGIGANSSPTTLQYDTYGRLSQEVFPTCSACGTAQGNPQLSQIVWDPQNQLMQTIDQTFSYSTRGEALGASGSNLLADGVQVPIAAMPAQDYGNIGASWDPVAGAILAATSSLTVSELNGPTSSSALALSYDAAGRMATSASGGGSSSTNSSGATLTSSSSIQLARSYDDENRTVSTSLTSTSQPALKPATSVGALALYQWGASGHPVLIGSATNATAAVPSASSVTYDTLHWDGDRLIFTTNSSGRVDDIKIGASADITPLDPSFTGLTFWDRGPDGSVMYCHNNTGVGGGGLVDPYANAVPCVTGAITSTSGYTYYIPSSILWTSIAATGAIGIGQGGVLGMPRSDGLNDGVNIIQGVRTYDGNSGQWTTPDVYPAMPGNPWSGKKYLWNNGNPFSNSDPSGFDPNNTFAGCLGCLSWVNGMPQVIDTHGNVVTSIPVDEASAENGQQWSEPVGGTVGGIAAGSITEVGTEELTPFIAVPLSAGASFVGDRTGSYAASGLGYVWCGYVHECGPPPSWWAGAWRVASFAHIGWGVIKGGFRAMSAQAASDAGGELDYIKSFHTQAGWDCDTGGICSYGFLTIERFSDGTLTTWWQDIETNPITGAVLYFNKFCGSMWCEDPSQH